MSKASRRVTTGKKPQIRVMRHLTPGSLRATPKHNTEISTQRLQVSRNAVSGEFATTEHFHE